MKSQPNRTIDGSNDMKTKCSIARFIDNVRDDYTNGARDIYSDSMVFDLQFNGAAFELGENFGRPSFIHLLLLFFFFFKIYCPVCEEEAEEPKPQKDCCDPIRNPTAPANQMRRVG